MRRLILAAALFAAPALAAAGAPEPRRPVEIPRFMGQWFEILRTPNDAEAGCYATSQLWAQTGPGRFLITQVCHRGSADGPPRQVRTPARVLDAPNNAKFEASFFGGLLHRRYWVLDHADDYGWMIASTAAGDYVSVLARRPDLPMAQIRALLSRVDAMGLDARLLTPTPGAGS